MDGFASGVIARLLGEHQRTPRNTGKDYCEENLNCANQSVHVMGSFVISEGDYEG